MDNKISPRIPIVIQKRDGTEQVYWISLVRFMELRNKGYKIRRIPRKDYQSVRAPGKAAPDYEMEFIENIIDFGLSGLKFGEDVYSAEVVAKVEIKKNDVLLETFNIVINKEKLAREILEKIIGGK